MSHNVPFIRSLQQRFFRRKNSSEILATLAMFVRRPHVTMAEPIQTSALYIHIHWQDCTGLCEDIATEGTQFGAIS